MPATVIKGAFLMTEKGLKKDYGLRMEKDRIVQIASNEALHREAGDLLYRSTGSDNSAWVHQRA